MSEALLILTVDLFMGFFGVVFVVAYIWCWGSAIWGRDRFSAVIACALTLWIAFDIAKSTIS